MHDSEDSGIGEADFIAHVAEAFGCSEARAIQLIAEFLKESVAARHAGTALQPAAHALVSGWR